MSTSTIPDVFYVVHLSSKGYRLVCSYSFPTVEAARDWITANPLAETAMQISRTMPLPVGGGFYSNHLDIVPKYA